MKSLLPDDIVEKLEAVPEMTSIKAPIHLTFQSSNVAKSAAAQLFERSSRTAVCGWNPMQTAKHHAEFLILRGKPIIGIARDSFDPAAGRRATDTHDAWGFLSQFGDCVHAGAFDQLRPPSDMVYVRLPAAVPGTDYVQDSLFLVPSAWAKSDPVFTDGRHSKTAQAKAIVNLPEAVPAAVQAGDTVRLTLEIDTRNQPRLSVAIRPAEARGSDGESFKSLGDFPEINAGSDPMEGGTEERGWCWMVQCTQPTDIVRIDGEYPVKAKQRKKLPARQDPDAQLPHDEDEPLVQWRWAAPQLTFNANDSEAVVIISDSGPPGIYVEQSPDGRSVVSGFARTHDKGGENAAVVRKSVHIGDEICTIGGVSVDHEPIETVVSRLQHATHRPLALAFRPYGRRRSPSVLTTAGAPLPGPAGSIAIACTADATARRWAEIPREGRERTPAVKLSDGKWWYQSVLRPIDANAGGTHYAEFVLCDAVDGKMDRRAQLRLGDKDTSLCPSIRVGLMHGTKALQAGLLQRETEQIKAQALAEQDFEARKLLLDQLRLNLDSLAELRRPFEESGPDIENGSVVVVTQRSSPFYGRIGTVLGFDSQQQAKVNLREVVQPLQPQKIVRIKLSALALQSEVEKQQQRSTSSVTYCARDGCCWHDVRPVPGVEEWEAWQGHTSAAARRGSRIGLLLHLSKEDERVHSYGKITVFRDDQQLGEMSAGALIDAGGGPLFWTANIDSEGDSVSIEARPMHRWLESLHLPHLTGYLLRRHTNLGNVMLLTNSEIDKMADDTQLLRIMKTVLLQRLKEDERPATSGQSGARSPTSPSAGRDSVGQHFKSEEKAVLHKLESAWGQPDFDEWLERGKKLAQLCRSDTKLSDLLLDVQNKHVAVLDQTRHDMDILRRAIAGAQGQRFEQPAVEGTVREGSFTQIGYYSPSGHPLSPASGGRTPSPGRAGSVAWYAGSPSPSRSRPRSDSVTSHGSGHSAQSGELSPRQERNRRAAWEALTVKNWVLGFGQADQHADKLPNELLESIQRLEKELKMLRRQIASSQGTPRQDLKAKMRHKERDLDTHYAERLAIVLFHEADINRNGSIDLQEMRLTLKRFDVGLQDEMTEELFRMLDENENDSIELDDLKRAMVRLSETMSRPSARARRGSGSSFHLSPTSSRDDGVEGSARFPPDDAICSHIPTEILEFCRQHGMRDLVKEFDHTGKRHSEAEFLAMLWRKQLSDHRQSGKARMRERDFKGAADEADEAINLQMKLQGRDQKDALIALIGDIYRQREIDRGRATHQGQQERGSIPPLGSTAADQREAEAKMAESRMQMEEKLRAIGRAQLHHEYEQDPVGNKALRVIGWSEQELRERLERMDLGELKEQAMLLEPVSSPVIVLAATLRGSQAEHLVGHSHALMSTSTGQLFNPRRNEKTQRLKAGMILLSVEGVPVQGKSLAEVNELIASYRSAHDTLQLEFVQRPSEFEMRVTQALVRDTPHAGGEWKPVWRPTSVTMDSGRTLGLTLRSSRVAEALRSTKLQLPFAEQDELHRFRDRMRRQEAEEFLRAHAGFTAKESAAAIRCIVESTDQSEDTPLEQHKLSLAEKLRAHGDFDALRDTSEVYEHLRIGFGLGAEETAEAIEHLEGKRQPGRSLLDELQAVGGPDVLAEEIRLKLHKQHREPEPQLALDLRRSVVAPTAPAQRHSLVDRLLSGDGQSSLETPASAKADTLDIADDTDQQVEAREIVTKVMVDGLSFDSSGATNPNGEYVVDPHFDVGSSSSGGGRHRFSKFEPVAGAGAQMFESHELLWQGGRWQLLRCQPADSQGTAADNAAHSHSTIAFVDSHAHWPHETIANEWVQKNSVEGTLQPVDAVHFRIRCVERQSSWPPIVRLHDEDAKLLEQMLKQEMQKLWHEDIQRVAEAGPAPAWSGRVWRRAALGERVFCDDPSRWQEYHCVLSVSEDPSRDHLDAHLIPLYSQKAEDRLRAWLHKRRHLEPSMRGPQHMPPELRAVQQKQELRYAVSSVPRLAAPKIVHDGGLHYACGLLPTMADPQTPEPPRRPEKYRVLSKATVRAGPDKDDPKLLELQPGEIVEAVQEKLDKRGLVSLRLLEQAQGAAPRWVKLATSKGKRLLEPLVQEEVEFLERTLAVERSDCPQRHGLIQREVAAPATCALCSTLVPPPSEVHGCAECDYTVCVACFSESLPVLYRSSLGEGIEVRLLEQAPERQGPKALPDDVLKVRLEIAAGARWAEIDEAERRDALIDLAFEKQREFATVEIDCHPEFDVNAFVEQHFDLSRPCLVIRKAMVVWHCHGALASAHRESLLGHPHPARTGAKPNPIRATFGNGDFEAAGPVLCRGASFPEVAAKHHIADEQIAAWHGSRSGAAAIGDGGSFVPDWYGLECAMQRLVQHPVPLTLQQLFGQAERNLRHQHVVSHDTRISTPSDQYLEASFPGFAGGSARTRAEGAFLSVPTLGDGLLLRSQEWHPTTHRPPPPHRSLAQGGSPTGSGKMIDVRYPALQDKPAQPDPLLSLANDGTPLSEGCLVGKWEAITYAKDEAGHRGLLHIDIHFTQVGLSSPSSSSSAQRDSWPNSVKGHGMDEDGNEFDLIRFQYEPADRTLCFEQHIVRRDQSSSSGKRVWSCVVSADGTRWSRGTVSTPYKINIVNEIWRIVN